MRSTICEQRLFEKPVSEDRVPDLDGCERRNISMDVHRTPRGDLRLVLSESVRKLFDLMKRLGGNLDGIAGDILGTILEGTVLSRSPASDIVEEHWGAVFVFNLDL